MTLEPNSNDVSLIKRIAQRDQAALAELYDRYTPVLYSIAFKSLKTTEESKEVVLDVFSQVWKIAERYDASRGRVDAWLFAIIRSRILDKLRSRKRQAKILAASESSIQIQSHEQNVDPIEYVRLSEQRDQVLAALAQLPEAQRQVIELAYYEGLTQSEIADQLGLAPGTVKTRIRLALNKLRIALGYWNPG